MNFKLLGIFLMMIGRTDPSIFVISYYSNLLTLLKDLKIHVYTTQLSQPKS